MKKLRLLKVVVQPTFVFDDGENLNEVIAEPITVSPADWPSYATNGFVRAVDELEAKIAAGQETTKNK
jgi:hypothetical protein